MQANGTATVKSPDVVLKPAGPDGMYLFRFNDTVKDTNYSVIATTEQASDSDAILLIENYDRQDSDFNSVFTVKTYAIQNNISEEGWKHTEILLKPNLFDPSHKDIVFTSENGNNMHVIAEFIQVLA